MKQWTEQPDGTWRRGPLVVQEDRRRTGWLWVGEYDSEWHSTREEAQQAADAWAADMLAQLKELEE